MKAVIPPVRNKCPDLPLCSLASHVALEVKNPSANVRDAGSISGSGRSPLGRNGNPLQYPSQENSMDRGVWWATVHRAAKSQTRLKQRSTHAHTGGPQIPGEPYSGLHLQQGRGEGPQARRDPQSMGPEPNTTLQPRSSPAAPTHELASGDPVTISQQCGPFEASYSEFQGWFSR